MEKLKTHYQMAASKPTVHIWRGMKDSNLRITEDRQSLANSRVRPLR